MRILDMKFKKVGYKVYRRLLIMKDFTLLLLAMTSCIVIYMLGFGFFGKYIESEVWLKILASVTVLVYLNAIDLGLKDFLPWAMLEFLSGNFQSAKWRRKAFALVLSVVCLVQLTTTGSLSWLSSQDITEMSVKPPDMKDSKEIFLSRQKQFEQSKEVYDEDIKTLRQSEGKRIKEAKLAGSERVKDAINSKGKKMAQLYLGGNGWAAIQLQEAIQKAKKDSTSLVTTEIKKVGELIASRDEFVKTSAENDKLFLSPISDFQKTQVEDYQSKKESRISLIKWASLVLVLAYFLFTFLTSLFRASVEEEPHEFEKTLWTIAGEFYSKCKRKLVEKLDLKYGNVGLNYATGSGMIQTDLIQAESPEIQKIQPESMMSDSSVKTRVLDASRLKMNCRNHYRRSTQSADEKTRLENLRKFNQEKQALEAAGYLVVPLSNTSLDIRLQEKN